MESPHVLGDKQYRFFKFFSSNGNGKRVQVIAWNGIIDRVEHHVKLNFVSIYFNFVRLNQYMYMHEFYC